MEKIFIFCLVVGTIAFVFGQGFYDRQGYYTPNGQVGYVSGYPLGQYLRARDVYMRARLADRRQDSFMGDIIGLGALLLLYANYKNWTGTYLG